MAERRMFTKKITDSDPFTEMPLSAQALYFHLNMNADDDGFLNNPKKIQRSIGASDDDMKLLIAKRFILAFEKGVIVIKHWRMHNLLRKDRYTETQYIEEKDTLMLQKDGSYTEKSTKELPLATKWQPNGNQMATQYSIDKESIVEVSVDKDNTKAAENPLDVLPEDVRSAFNDFATMRKTKLKKPMTENAVKRMLTKLNSLSTDEATQIAILNQSEDNCWLDIYPLKTDKPNQQKSSNPFLDMVEEGVFDE